MRLLALAIGNRRHQTVLISVACRLGPVGRAGLVQDAPYVVAHGPEADEEFFGDFPVGLTQGD